ncbi:MAG TPA: site-specific integrase [Rhodopseudomonas sp.]|uniref:site-specific integrase n=1 Tax=Rhodopseudomonas sp. TaxID=1078 RepID=UPI002ED77F15
MPKPLKLGRTGFYFNVPSRYRKYGCTVANEPLGTDFAKMVERAATLNGLIDEWNDLRKGIEVLGESAPRAGTIDWLMQEYKRSKAYLEKVAPGSRSSYEKTMRMVTDTTTKAGERIGCKPIKSVTPRAADKLYEKFTIGKKGQLRLRQAEKAVVLCRKAWRVVHRLFPEYFNTGKDEIPNPWPGVTMNTRIVATKAAVTRDQVYAFAYGCIEHGEVEVAAAAVICFEWLQRPENVIAGHLTWADYRPKDAPTIIRILHHKTGAIVLHPLEETTDGGVVHFYPEAEEILAHLPHRGVPMILREVAPGKSKPFAQSSIQHIVQRMRKKLKLPATFTLDACRHGGMTELEEAELTDGQGRALSAHRTQQSYEGYAKRNIARALSATRKRHAHRLVNEKATSVQNISENGCSERGPEQSEISEQ